MLSRDSIFDSWRRGKREEQAAMTLALPALGRRPAQIIGGWEIGLLVMMALLYIVGAFLNPNFFASPDAFHALLRDASRYAVMAVGMTFVIANKDLDLSIGSTYGLVGVAFAYVFDPNHADLGVVPAIVCLALGTLIGLLNGVLVTILRVPAFIATLTMLLIGRGFVLGLTHGSRSCFRSRRMIFNGSSSSAIQRLRLQQQIPIALGVVALGAAVLARNPLGLRDLRHRRREQAAIYAGIPTRWVRTRGFCCPLCATIAGLMATAQDKGISPQSGLSAELIVMPRSSSAARDPGRARPRRRQLHRRAADRLINKVLRGACRSPAVMIDGEPTHARQLFAAGGGCPSFHRRPADRRRLTSPHHPPPRPARLWAWLRGLPPPTAFEIGGVAIEGRPDQGRDGVRQCARRQGFGKFLARRDALAIIPPCSSGSSASAAGRTIGGISPTPSPDFATTRGSR
jgi:ribose transport system permease protein